MLYSLAFDNTLPAAAVCITGLILLLYVYLHHLRQPHPSEIPVSVNYFPSRKCNYECGFCFHTEKTSFILPIAEAKRGLNLLHAAGMRKLNVAGGEPFLYPIFLEEMIRYAKRDLQLESVSIISNGSKIREKFVRDNSAFIDILAISCDSAVAETNIGIGRGTTGENVERLRRIAGWCREYGIMFKINTVVNSLNWNEDMTGFIAELQPFRWKAFQCLIVTGENDNEKRKRDARNFLVTEEQWKVFCDRHKHLECFVPESNKAMKGSYLLLDEYMRFLDKGDGVETASESILDVGVKKAMRQVVWERDQFIERGGLYDWTKPSVGVCGEMGEKGKGLEW